jgi:hypothetical protein
MATTEAVDEAVVAADVVLHEAEVVHPEEVASLIGKAEPSRTLSLS